MSKPSIAALLRASGHTVFTTDLVVRAVNTLYGNIGAGLDERDWDAILAEADPLRASEIALVEMYQDAAFLKRNADHLAGNYSAAQIEYTYRQIAERLEFTHSADWTAGTRYAAVADLSDASVIARARGEVERRQDDDEQNASITITAFDLVDSTTLSVTADEAGTAILQAADATEIARANLVAGVATTINIAAQDTVTASQLTVVDSAGNEITSATGVVLGTNGDDGTIEFDFAVDSLFWAAYDGDDTLVSISPSDMLDGGNGRDTFFPAVNGVATFDSDASIQNIEEVSSNFLTSINIDLSSQTEGFTFRVGNADDVIIGSSGDDQFDGEAGENLGITGGSDLSGGDGDDTFTIRFQGDVVVDNPTPTTIDGGAGQDTLVLLNYAGTAVGTTATNVLDLADFDASQYAGDADAFDNFSNLENVDLGDEDSVGFTLRGTNGANTLTGGGLDDVLEGRSGDDELNGGAGDDMISGGAGGDTLTGGPGADLFVQRTGHGVDSPEFVTGGVDMVTDFSAADGDILQIEGGLRVNDLQSATDFQNLTDTDDGIYAFQGSLDEGQFLLQDDNANPADVFVADVTISTGEVGVSFDNAIVLVGGVANYTAGTTIVDIAT